MALLASLVLDALYPVPPPDTTTAIYSHFIDIEANTKFIMLLHDYVHHEFSQNLPRDSSIELYTLTNRTMRAWYASLPSQIPDIIGIANIRGDNFCVVRSVLFSINTTAPNHRYCILVLLKDAARFVGDIAEDKTEITLISEAIACIEQNRPCTRDDVFIKAIYILMRITFTRIFRNTHKNPPELAPQIYTHLIFPGIGSGAGPPIARGDFEPVVIETEKEIELIFKNMADQSRGLNMPAIHLLAYTLRIQITACYSPLSDINETVFIYNKNNALPNIYVVSQNGQHYNAPIFDPAYCALNPYKDE